MIIITIFLILLLIPLNINAAMTATSPATHDLTYQQASASLKKSTGYCLVTTPTIVKQHAESMFKLLQIEAPGSEIRSTMEERVVYRVVVNYYDNIASAKKMQAELQKIRETPFIIKTKSSFYVVASSHLTKNEARAEQTLLRTKNLVADIVKINLPLQHWQISSGTFYNLRDVANMANQLAIKGVVTTIELRENRSN
jgi:hypothetical protein